MLGTALEFAPCKTTSGGDSYAFLCAEHPALREPPPLEQLQLHLHMFFIVAAPAGPAQNVLVAWAGTQ